MKAATLPIQRPRDARLLVVEADGRVAAHARADLPGLLAAGDLVVANDAATLPASLARPAPGERRSDRAALGRTRLVRRTKRSAALQRRRLRRRRLPRPHRRPAVAAAARARRSPGARTARSRGAAHARPSAPGRDPLRRQRRRGQRRHRPARPAGAVRASRRAARALGRVDTDRRAAGRLRAAVGGLRPRLALARCASPARHRLRDADACRRPVVDRRSGARRAPAARRALSPAAIDRRRDRRREGARRPHRGHRHDRRPRARARRGPCRRRCAPATASPPTGSARASGLRVVDVLVSGTHEPGTSHHELLRAFVGERTLARIDAALEGGAWRTHEFGDSVWIERERAQPRWNLNTATPARRLGQVRTTLPA